MKQQKEYYVNPDELHQQLKIYKDTGEITNRLGEILYLMCDRILRHSNFNGYSQDLKEEMRSYAILLLMRYLHNINPDERNARNCFNYITASIFNAFRQILIKYYKVQNLKRELTDAYILFFNTTYGTDISNEYFNNFKLEENKND